MIRNVVFDMGGVLIDLHIDRMIEAFRKIADPDKMREMSVLDLLGNGGTSSLHDYECGLISTDEWIADMLSQCRPGTTVQQVLDASFAILGDIPEERLEAIRVLRDKGYHTYLLSNIQDAHWEYISSRWLGGISIPTADGGLTPNDYVLFDELILSQRVGHTKPDAEIYEALLSKTGIDPSESLYFDDVLPNVEGGLRVGLQAVEAKGNEWLPIVNALPELTD